MKIKKIPTPMLLLLILVLVLGIGLIKNKDYITQSNIENEAYSEEERQKLIEKQERENSHDFYGKLENGENISICFINSGVRESYGAFAASIDPFSELKSWVYSTYSCNSSITEITFNDNSYNKFINKINQNNGYDLFVICINDTISNININTYNNLYKKIKDNYTNCEVLLRFEKCSDDYSNLISQLCTSNNIKFCDSRDKIENFNNEKYIYISDNNTTQNDMSSLLKEDVKNLIK